MSSGKTHKSAAKKPAGKVFDVLRPGKAPASPTSRPVIAGHKASAQAAQVGVSGIGEPRVLLDPKQKIEVRPTEPKEASRQTPPETSVDPLMPAAEPSAETPHEAEAIGGEVVKVTVQPPSQSSTKIETPMEPAGPPPVPESTPETQAEPEPSSAAEPEPPAPVETETRPAESQPAPPSDLSPATLSKEESNVLINEDPAEGQIIVSHHAGSGAGWHIFFILLLILLLAAAAIDILIDAGILNWDFIPHTDFFEE